LHAESRTFPDRVEQVGRFGSTASDPFVPDMPQACTDRATKVSTAPLHLRERRMRISSAARTNGRPCDGEETAGSVGAGIGIKVRASAGILGSVACAATRGLISVNASARVRLETCPVSWQESAVKILIAADGSSYTKRMLAYIAAHDEWLGAEHDYTVIHGVLAVPQRAAALVGHKVVREHYEADAEEVFRPIRAFFAQQTIAAKFVHTVGHVADSIAALAREGDFDLLVMGCRGHGDVVNLVLGSVSTRVLAKTSVPVLLIR
jgi:nucleotide-binding universal stress UspA family protein